jgi:hypothetical protein
LTDYADLKKRLRERKRLMPNGFFSFTDTDPLNAEAADAIAALEKQVADAREALQPFGEWAEKVLHPAIGSSDGIHVEWVLTRGEMKSGTPHILAGAFRRAQEIAALSRPLQSGDIGDQEARRDDVAEREPDSGEGIA